MYLITIINYYFLFTYALLIFIDVIREDYPDKYQKIKTKCEELRNNLLYNALYTYSKFQIIYGKCASSVFDFANKNGLLIKNVENNICQISYDKVFIRNHKNDNDTYFEDVDNCFYIFNDNKNISKTKCVNKIISRTQQFNTNYEVSDIKFILVEIKLNDNTFKVELKTEEENYYIVNNILDKNFFIYYLRDNRLCTLSKFDIFKIDKLNIKIIDHNVNIINLEITDKNYLLIKKDNYIYTKQ
jgi:hypothetical protein